MSLQPADPDLRDRLGDALPDSYPSLDLDAVLASGRRTVRRRRVGGLVAAAAAALVVTLGATQLAGGSVVTAPQPAQTGTSSPERFSAGTATLSVGQPGRPAHTWTVDISATGDDGTQGVTWREGSGSSGTFGSAASHDVAVWATPTGSPYMLGLVPDEAADTRSLLTSDTTHGDSAVDIVRVPGTGWSAFVIAFAKPFQGYDRVNHLLWFDRAGRPVDEVGDVGAVTTIGRDTVWVSAHGIVLGVSEDGGLYSTPMDGTDDKSAYGDWPRLTLGGKDGTPVWHMVLRMRSVATRATLVFSDGQRVDVVPVRLGGYSVAVTPTMSAQRPPDLVRVEWTDPAGQQHDDAVPPPSFGTS